MGLRRYLIQLIHNVASQNAACSGLEHATKMVLWHWFGRWGPLISRKLSLRPYQCLRSRRLFNTGTAATMPSIFLSGLSGRTSATTINSEMEKAHGRSSVGFVSSNKS